MKQNSARIALLCMLLFSSLLSSAQYVWQPIDGPGGVYPFSLATTQPGTIYMYTRNDGVYRSQDYGENWTRLNRGISDNFRRSASLHSNAQGDVYLWYSPEKLYQLNSTEEWELLSFPAPATAEEYEFFQTGQTGEIFLIAEDGQVTYSPDGSQTFETLVGADQVTGEVRLAQMTGGDKNYLLSSEGSNFYLYQVKPGADNSAELLYEHTGSFIRDMLYDLDEDAIYMVSAEEVIRSTDNGSSWTTLQTNQNVEFVPAQSRILYSVPDGVRLLSDDYRIWAISGNQMFPQAFFTFPAGHEIKATTDAFMNIHFAWEDRIYLFSSTCGFRSLFTSSDGGQSWFNLQGLFDQPGTLDFFMDRDRGNMYALTCGSPYYRYSWNGGKSWSLFFVGPDAEQVKDMSISPQYHYFAVTESDRFFRSTDGGYNWEELSISEDFTPIPLSRLRRSRSNTFRFSSAPNEVYALSNKKLFKSTDNGDNWSLIDVPLSFSKNDKLWIHPNGDLYLRKISGGDIDVYQSKDDGVNWLPISYILQDESPSFYELFFSEEGKIFVDDGVPGYYYVSTDEGNSFTAFNNSFQPIGFNQQEYLFGYSNSGLVRTDDFGITETYNYNMGWPDRKIGEHSFWGVDDQLFLGFSSQELLKTTLPTSYSNRLIGQVSWDENSNCEYENDELLLDEWIVRVGGGTVAHTYGSSNSEGYYRLRRPEGSHSARLLPPNDLWSVCESDQSFNLTGTEDTVQLDWHARAVESCPYLSVGLSTPRLRPCQENTYTMQYCNRGTAMAPNARVKVTLDPAFEFISSDIDPVSIDGQEYTFELGDLLAQDCGRMQLQLLLDCNAEPQQAFCIEANITPEELCLPSLDSLSRAKECRTPSAIRASNEIFAFIDGQLAETVIPPDQKWITYLVHFQNTHTSQSPNFVVQNELPYTLVPTSVQLLASSHPCEVELYGERTVLFRMQESTIPTSEEDEEGSHGFVKYRVALEEGLPISTAIVNKAYTHFQDDYSYGEYHQPSRTENTSIFFLGATSDVDEQTEAEHRFTVMPNPAEDYIDVLLENLPASSYRVALHNAHGQLIRTERFQGKSHHMPLHQLPAGFYSLRLFSEDSQQFIGSQKVVLR